MAKHGSRGFRRLVDATRYSVSGLRQAWRSEEAFRQESLLLLPAVPLALWLGEGPRDWALLLGSWILVLIVELLNTAIEYTVDRIGPEHHELAGGAKDMGSAAVMLSTLIAALTWGAVAWERFF